jgi:AcrR family transcriptional regulator
MAVRVKPTRKYTATLRREQAQMTRQRILDAGRRLLVSGSYSGVTMDDIAKEAGVAYQTVYSAFGSKLGLAQAIIEAGFPHIDDAMMLTREPQSPDPEVRLRTVARITRLIYEPCADLVRFMRESGDAVLVKRYRENEELRYARERRGLGAWLRSSDRLRRGISPSEALAVIWSMTSSEHYTQLVFERGWTPSRYEEWLGDALINVLLKPQSQRSR